MPKFINILAWATLVCLWAAGANASLIYDLQAFSAFPEFAITGGPSSPAVPPPILPETVFSPAPLDSGNNTVTDPSLTVVEPVLQDNEPAPGQNQDVTIRTDVPVAPVPEPSALILLGAGLGALAIWRRKKNQ